VRENVYIYGPGVIWHAREAGPAPWPTSVMRPAARAAALRGVSRLILAGSQVRYQALTIPRGRRPRDGRVS